MRTYDQLIDDVAEPRTINPKVFVGDENVPQALCDFVLALALVFNDFKDLMAVQQLMQVVAPGEGPPDAARGMYGGFHVHWLRWLAGVVHELTELIGKNRGVIDTDVFRGFLKKTSPAVRKLWSNVIAATDSGGAKGNDFGRLIYYTRVKVGFHYDPKEIARGYRERFLSQGRHEDSESHDDPYVSVGKNMAATRFYFADAAAEKYMLGKAGAATGVEFFNVGWQLLPDIGHALREIVSTFVKLRGAELERRQRRTLASRTSAED